MAESDRFQRIGGDIDQLRREVDALERKLATLSPEDIAQLQVKFAVLENSLLNLKNHIDGKQTDTKTEIERLDKEKLSKHEARIPHMLIYGIAGAMLMAVVGLIFEKIGLHITSLH